MQLPQFLRRPTYRETVKRELEQARIDLLAAITAREQYQAAEAALKLRVSRLEVEENKKASAA